MRTSCHRGKMRSEKQLRVWFCQALVWLGLANVSFAIEMVGRFEDGSRSPGQLAGSSPEELVFHAKDESFSLDKFRRIEFPRSSPVLQNRQRVFVFELRGGGTVIGELLRFADQEISIVSFGQRLTLPVFAVVSIGELRGERAVLWEDFPSEKLSPIWKTSGQTEPATLSDRSVLKLSGLSSVGHSLKKPLTGVRLAASFQDPKPESRDSKFRLELEFAEKAAPRKVAIELASLESVYSVSPSPNVSLQKQPLQRGAGWHRVTVLADETRFQVLIDSHLLAYGRPIPGPLTSFRFTCEPLETATREFSVDDLDLSELTSKFAAVRPILADKQSQVIDREGNAIYGEVISIDKMAVRLRGAFGELAFPWPQIRQVQFSDEIERKPEDLPPISPMGWQVNVHFQPFADHPYQPGGQWPGTLLAVSADTLTLSHPWLGTLDVSDELVDGIEPRFFGRSQFLALQSRHLGNQAQSGFHHPETQGTTWSGEFSLEPSVLGKASLRIRAADLEPSGPETPLGSRYLSELRNGGLATEVFVNGSSLGRLNDAISKKANPESPQEIRLSIPEGLLKAGKNHWAILQTSMRQNRQEYDDCELGPIVLEMEKTSPDLRKTAKKQVAEPKKVNEN